MENNEFFNEVKSTLPKGSEILTLKEYYNMPALIVSDLNGDNKAETIVAYKFNNLIYVSVLEKVNDKWVLEDTEKYKGVGVSELLAIPIENKDVVNLVVGIKLESGLSKLYIYTFKNKKLVSSLNENVYYDKIEFEGTSEKATRGNVYDVIIWQHNDLNAYDVEVYVLEGGKLSPFKGNVERYFKRMEDYYLDLIDNEGPKEIYLYQLANAEFRAGEIRKAINTLNVLIQISSGDKQKAINLKNKYEKML